MSLLTSKEERQIFVVEDKDFNPNSETSQDFTQNVTRDAGTNASFYWP